MTTPKAEEKPDATPAPKTFTQDEVNAYMGKVRAEERGKYTDYERLKERAKVADQLESANLSAKDKADRAAAEWQRKAVDAEARAADTAIRAEIKVKAMSQGAIDPDAVVALIDRNGISYSDESGVQGVTEALSLLLDAKPYLRAVTAKPSAPNLNTKDGKPAPAAPQLTDAQRNVAHRLYSELNHTDAEIKYSKGLAPKT